MNNGVIIREATEKDISEIAALFETEMHWLINRDVWEWEYFKRKGHEPCFVVAEKDGRIIGTQAYIPIKMISNKRIFLTGKSESTLICKQNRGQGIFERMYLKLFEIAKQRGVAVIWGFTGATKAFSQLGFTVPARLSQDYIFLDIRTSIKFFLDKLRKYYGNLSYLVAFPLIMFLLLKRLRLWVSLTYYGMKYSSYFKNVCELTKADDDFNKLLSQMNDQHQINGVVTIYRDDSYMNWRIFNNPCIDYKILMYSEGETRGYMIFYIREGIIAITDYYCTIVDKIFPLLLNRVLRYGLINKIWCVQFCDHESTENQKYRKYFKFYSSMKFKNRTPMVLRIIGDGLIAGEMDIGEWFITDIFSQGIS